MPGCWVPVISIVLEVRGWEHLTDWAFVIPSLGAIVSPLFLGAIADQRVNAERVLAGVLVANSFATAAAFWFLGKGDSQFWFLAFLCVKALVGAPSWSLLMSITLTHLTHPEREFGVVRVWGTVGWMVAGWGVSFFALDRSPYTGLVAAVIGLFAAGFCLSLPPTPPNGFVSRSLSESLGLKAFGILRNRDTAVYFVTAFLFSLPLAAYYPYSSKYLVVMGVENVARMLSVGQLSEIIAMLLMGWTFRKFRVKWVFLIALGAGLLRYLFYILPICNGVPDGEQLVWMFAGIFMHGFCWTLFFESGRLFVDRRVANSMRSQAQAMLTVWSSGVATVLGVFLSGTLYRWCVLSNGPGWMGFWSILSALCLFAAVVFAIGYQGRSRLSSREEE